MKGQELIKNIIAATGLPIQSVSKELERLIERSQIDPSTMTIDELRPILADYLHEVLQEMFRLSPPQP